MKNILNSDWSRFLTGAIFGSIAMDPVLHVLRDHFSFPTSQSLGVALTLIASWLAGLVASSAPRKTLPNKLQESTATPVTPTPTLTERALSQLVELPQFIAYDKGVCNMFNGCKITSDKYGLLLIWGESGIAGRASLQGLEEIEKFLLLMQFQAAALNQS